MMAAELPPSTMPEEPEMRPRTTRRVARLLGVALALGGLVATTACTGDEGDKAAQKPTEAETPTGPDAASASPSPSPSPSAVPTSVPPAAEAGGICKSITFSEVKTYLGLTFQVAAASGKEGGVRTCVLQPLDESLPDLTFVATPLDGEVSEDDYEKDFVPDKADDQNGLGRAAYKRVVAPSGANGPVAEVGWLGEETAYTLTLTLAQATGTTGANTYLPKLAGLGPKLIAG
ncbi:hypothetical protein [Cryptosporangium phraense]|uniref:DUF3558 domain-containing protein n=1 Tax=Cryptosporangium phraense TaxID=2593070 RepID=A0A545AW73_9ACTN|nr:hypothetical protein [Cryptosporangium phraense]TQS44865.1 hypothetical protein FL583_13030 [Cryptosporangium phraense]